MTREWGKKWNEMIGECRKVLTEMTDGWRTNKDEMTGE